MKKNTPKKLLIPLITTTCIMYGCSSAPVSSPEAETTAEIQSNETAPEESKTAESTPNEPTTTPSDETKETDENNTGNETDSTDTEKAEHNADDETDRNKSNDNNKNNDNNNESSDKNSENESSNNENSEDENSEDENTKKDKFIQTVKEAHPESFSGCTYGNAFEEFFTSPQWTYFESSDGRNVVEFTGECMYDSAPTKTRMQFIINQNNSTVTTGALYYNNTPQNTKIITESLNRIFEQYARAHDIAYTPSSSTAANNSQTTALPPETQTENTQTTQAGNTQSQNTSEITTVNSGSAQAALEFAAWTNPDIGSWHSASTGYYIIPYIDSAGNASLQFASENTRAASATVYYTDAVSAVTNDAGGLTYQAYLYKPSGETQQLVGMVEVTWNSIAELKSLSVKMINGNQAMDNSMAGTDYTYFGAVN